MPRPPHDFASGTVSLDVHHVRDLTLARLSDAIDMVTQETYLVQATVRENPACAKPDATLEQVVHTARASPVHDPILELENGYDTVVDERVIDLRGESAWPSLGRCSRTPTSWSWTSMARALDTASERLVQAALEPRRRGQTTMAMANRLSTTCRCGAGTPCADPASACRLRDRAVGQPPCLPVPPVVLRPAHGARAQR